MNLRDLQYLVAVADHQNFNKAAKASFISQPTLSMQLKKLEEYLGVTLFERSNKQVRITPVGEEIANRARRILQEAEEIREVARSFQDPLAGEFRLGAFPTLAPYLLPKIVPPISRQYPKIKLLLIEDKTPRLIEQLLQGEIDAALLALPVMNPLLESAVLLTEDFYLAVPNTHPFAQQQMIKQEQLRDQNLLLLEDGHCLRDQALEVCQLAGAGEVKGFRATSLETLRQMVAAGVGMTLIPKMAINDDPHIAYIPIAAPSPQRTIALIWRKTSPRAKAMVALVGSMRGLVGSS